jgi:hypothetical protein
VILLSIIVFKKKMVSDNKWVLNPYTWRLEY